MEQKVLAALIVVVLLVVGVNGVLFLMLRRSNPGQHVQLWQKAAHRARHPWEEEDRQLKELSEQVKELKQEQTRPDD